MKNTQISNQQKEISTSERFFQEGNAAQFFSGRRHLDEEKKPTQQEVNTSDKRSGKRDDFGPVPGGCRF